MIKVKAPRYRDRVVLLARYKLPCGGDVEVEIQEGAYAGIYWLKNEDIIKAPIESMNSRYGKSISMRAVPLDALERVADLDNQAVLSV